MKDLSHYILKLKAFARHTQTSRRRDPTELYGQVITSSYVKSCEQNRHTAILCELEAVEKMTSFEMDGSTPTHDQDEWIGFYVWDLFMRVKFIESKPKAGVSPVFEEMSGFLMTDFKSGDAIKQIIQDNPHLKRQFYQSRCPSIYKILGLMVNNSPHLDLQHIFAALAPFCPQPSLSTSQIERSTSAIEHPSSSSNSTVSMPLDCRDIPQRQRKVNYALFTSRLNEYGQRNGIRAIYTESMMSITPLVFKVCVNYNGTEGQAEGGNLRETKHLASKNLCDILGLELD